MATKRNYKKEYKQFHSKPSEIRKRASRNKARADMNLNKGDGKEVDHIKPLSKGGGAGKGNLRTTTQRVNRESRRNRLPMRSRMTRLSRRQKILL